MECPSCNKTAITYTDWINSLRWHKTSCINCGVKLSAKAWVYIGIVLAYLSGVAVVLYLEITFELSRLVGVPIGLGLVLIISTATFYVVKGYKLAK